MNTKYPLLWSALSLALGVVLYDTFPSFSCAIPGLFLWQRDAFFFYLSFFAGKKDSF